MVGGAGAKFVAVLLFIGIQMFDLLLLLLIL